MSWITVSSEEVLSAGSKERITIANAKNKDDLANLVNDAIQVFRGAIAGRGYPLGPDGTIPAAVKPNVIAFSLWRFVTLGLPKNEMFQTKVREEEYKDARRVLTSISEGKFGIEPPAGFSSKSSFTGSSTQITGRLGMNN